VRHSCPSSVRGLLFASFMRRLGFPFTDVLMFGCSTIMPKDIQLYVTYLYIVLDARDACVHTCVPCSEPGEFEESALDCACLVNSCTLM
jgi:hypothetical protein